MSPRIAATWRARLGAMSPDVCCRSRTAGTESRRRVIGVGRQRILCCEFPAVQHLSVASNRDLGFALLAFGSSDVTPRRQVRLHGVLPSAATRSPREQLEELAPGLVTAAAPGQSNYGTERQRRRGTGKTWTGSCEATGRGIARCRTAPAVPKGKQFLYKEEEK